MDIKEETKFKWVSIFAALGINVGESGRHCACPICGPGRNSHRFRMDGNEDGIWICSQCGAGDGFSLVMKVLKIDFKEAVCEIKKVLGTADMTIQQPEKKVSKELLRKIYSESTKVCEGDPVSKYLRNRGISILSERLRYHPSCYEPETHTNMPAMLATFMLPDGTAITIHRTFITMDGQKAKILNPKKLLPSLKQMAGGAIRLFEPTEGLLGVTEGIETALAVYESTGIPTWSLVSSTLMERFEPPKGIKHVMVFADRDANYTGQKAAYVLANRLAVRDKITTEVYLPKDIGDFLDELNGTIGIKNSS